MRRAVSRDAHGASLLEYLVLLAGIALAALGAVELFSSSARGLTARNAACAATIDECSLELDDAADGPLTGAAPEDQPRGRSGQGSAATPEPPSLPRQLVSAVTGTATGVVKWSYNAIAGTAGLINAPIDWALRQAGVPFQFGQPQLLQTNPYERSAGYAMDTVTIVGGLATKVPWVAVRLGIAAPVYTEASFGVLTRPAQSTASADAAAAGRAAEAQRAAEEAARAARAEIEAVRAQAAVARVVEERLAQFARVAERLEKGPVFVPRTPAELAAAQLQSELSAIAQENGVIGGCAVAARDMALALQKAGQPGRYIHIDVVEPILKGSGGRWDVLEGEIIGYRGHDAVETAGRIYDNMHPQGLAREEWFTDLKVRTQQGLVTLGEYIKSGRGTVRETNIPMPPR